MYISAPGKGKQRSQSIDGFPISNEPWSKINRYVGPRYLPNTKGDDAGVEWWPTIGQPTPPRPRKQEWGRGLICKGIGGVHPKRHIWTFVSRQETGGTRACTHLLGEKYANEERPEVQLVCFQLFEMTSFVILLLLQSAAESQYQVLLSCQFCSDYSRDSLDHPRDGGAGGEEGPLGPLDWGSEGAQGWLWCNYFHQVLEKALLLFQIDSDWFSKNFSGGSPWEGGQLSHACLWRQPAGVDLCNNCRQLWVKNSSVEITRGMRTKATFEPITECFYACTGICKFKATGKDHD